MCKVLYVTLTAGDVQFPYFLKSEFGVNKIQLQLTLEANMHCQYYEKCIVGSTLITNTAPCVGTGMILRMPDLENDDPFQKAGTLQEFEYCQPCKVL